jgi:hypothetical protein
MRVVLFRKSLDLLFFRLLLCFVGGFLRTRGCGFMNIGVLAVDFSFGEDRRDPEGLAFFSFSFFFFFFFALDVHHSSSDGLLWWLGLRHFFF